MRTQCTALSIALAGVLAISFASVKGEAQALKPASNLVKTAPYTISKPFTVGNLSVFLVCGKDKVPGQKYLTLKEGVAQKEVIVRETADVNLLKIDNLSNAVVFIQSGQIVKGGQQDRALQSDMLIAPHAKNMDLPCFCVEHGRWSQRVGESVDKFDSANDFVVGNSVLLPVKKDKEQSKVWDGVSGKQQELSKSLARNVAAAASPSSMQLTIEQKAVKDATGKNVQALAGIVDQQKDAIGYAVAINGKVTNVDVYASGALFKKLWPGLLKSVAVEAVAEKGHPVAKKQPTEADVLVCLNRGEAAPKKADPIMLSNSSYNSRFQSNSVAQYYNTGSQTQANAARGNAPQLQGATNGTIGAQGADATYVTGVNTAGSIRQAQPANSGFFFSTQDNSNGVAVHKNYINNY